MTTHELLHYDPSLHMTERERSELITAIQLARSALSNSRNLLFEASRKVGHHHRSGLEIERCRLAVQVSIGRLGDAVSDLTSRPLKPGSSTASSGRPRP